MTVLPRAILQPAGSDQAAGLRELARGLGRARESAVVVPAAEAPMNPVSRRAGRAARVIAFASGKGGVGKTSVCVNTGVLLAQRGVRTVILDADLGLANADLLLGVSVRDTLAHVAAGLRTVRQVALNVMPNLVLVPGASGLASMADLGEGPRATLINALGELARESDVVLVDCGAGVSPSVLGFMSAADHCVIVTTPEPTAFADAYATIKCAVRRARASAQPDPALALLVNQCRHAAEGQAVFARVSAVCRKFLGYEPCFAGWVPEDDHVSRAVCLRVPLAVQFPRSRACRAIHQIADDLVVRTGCATTGCDERNSHR